MANILTKSKKSKLPEIHPGDVVRIHQKITEGGKERVQVFEGIVIKTHLKTGPNATFTVRKIASGVGVERTYLLQSPNIVKIEFKKGSRVRRSKLYYLRNLSGKALKMKDKKIDKDVWEMVAGADEEKSEPTEEELAEAVDEAAKQEKSEPASDTDSGKKTDDSAVQQNDQPTDDSPKDDTVKKEEKSDSEPTEGAKS